MELSRLIKFYTMVDNLKKDKTTRYFTLEVDSTILLSKELLQQKNLEYYNKLMFEIQEQELLKTFSDYKTILRSLYKFLSYK